MKILALTYGTEGDVRPLAALCRALIDAGHRAHLLAPPDVLAAPRALGVPASALQGDIREVLRDNGSGAKAMRALVATVNDRASAWLRLALDLGQGCDALLVAGFAAFVGSSAAERLGARAVGVGLFPITPTADFASPFLPPGRTPPWLNAASQRWINALLWRSTAEATNAARREIGLAPQRRVWTDLPMLYGISPQLIARPSDWPANVSLCGAWPAPEPNWAPPPALDDFLAIGPPPIYVGFGSMPVADPDALLRAVVEGLAGRRALLYPGWSGIEQPDLPRSIHVIGPTPHDWLLPRTAMAIHHGGAGTTHSAAAAGVPSIVVPFGGDQPFWADRLRRLGVAPPPLARRRLGAAALARAIAFADGPAVRARAADLGRRMAAEDGLGVAVAQIEQILARR